MSISFSRTRNSEPQTDTAPAAQPDDTRRELERARQANADLAGRCAQLEENNGRLRDALYEAERENSALERDRDALLTWCLPMLEPGTWAEDPMPADARISRKGDGRLCGTWDTVHGDKGADYGDVPEVDFDAIRAELGLQDETAEATA